MEVIGIMTYTILRLKVREGDGITLYEKRNGFWFYQDDRHNWLACSVVTVKRLNQIVKLESDKLKEFISE